MSGGVDFTEGRAVAVDVSTLEKELANLWRQGSTQDSPVLRACMWNLLVYTTHVEDVAPSRDVLSLLVQARPARVILMAPGDDDAPELSAWASAHCHRTPSGNKLCSESITLEARNGGWPHIPSLVRALLVPDVPSALWWVGPPPMSSAEVEPFCRGLSRLMVDSRRARLGTSPWATLVQLMERRVPVVDLGWLVLAPVRLGLAALFDTPHGPAQLQRLSQVVIRGGRGGITSAHLMIGWLASRLKWNFGVSTGPQRWAFHRPEGGVIEVSWQESPQDATGIGSITLETELEDNLIFVPATPTARVDQEMDSTHVDRVQAEVELVIAALGGQGQDPLWREAVQSAARL